MRRLARTPEAPARARRFIRKVAGPDIPPEKLEDALLLTSELVANATRHVDPSLGDSLGVSATTGDGCLTVTVSDPGAGFERRRVSSPATRETGGWGLVLVERIAARWDVVSSETGTEVSFVVDWT